MPNVPRSIRRFALATLCAVLGFAGARTADAQPPIAGPRGGHLATRLLGAAAYAPDRLGDSVTAWVGDLAREGDEVQASELRAALALPTATDRPALRVLLLSALSQPYWRLDSLERGFAVLYDAIELAERYDSAALAELHLRLAEGYLAYEDYDGAIEQLLQARRLARRMRRRSVAARALYELVELHARLGQRPRAAEYARAYFDEVMLHRVDDPEQRLRAFHVLGLAAAFEQRGEVARGYFEEAYQIAKADLGPQAIAFTVNGRLRSAPNVYSPGQRLRTARFLRREVGRHLSASELTGADLAGIEALLDLQRYATARDSLARIPRQGEPLLEARRLTLLERTAVGLEDFAEAYFTRLHRDRLDANVQARRREGRVAAAEARYSLDEYRAAVAALEQASAEQEDRLARSDTLTFAALLALLLTIITLSATYQQKVRRAQSEERLQALVRERTGDLEARNRELERFNTALSHDLKEPLRSVVSFSELAARSVGDHPAREYLEHVERSGRQLHDLVGGILHFQSCPPETRQACDLADVAHDALARTRERVPGRAIDLAAVDLPTVDVPAELMRECLEIAFANAARFNDAVGVELSVQYYGRGGQHRLLVVDNGIGIPAEYHERVFELFGRLHPRDRYGGAGLGLARLRRLMERVGGSARVARSVVGQGTAIELAWSDPDDAPQRRPRRSAAEVPGRGDRGR